MYYVIDFRKSNQDDYNYLLGNSPSLHRAGGDGHQLVFLRGRLLRRDRHAQVGSHPVRISSVNQEC